MVLVLGELPRLRRVARLYAVRAADDSDLSSIIAGEGRALEQDAALVLSGAYVLGMALAYAVAGVAAGFSGSLLAAALQNAWVLGAFALVFVGLALSMFGFYDLQLPGFIHHRLHGASATLQGGRVASVAAMGALPR